MFLVDANIFLEVMLGQEKSTEVKDFFNRADFSSLFMSDFSLFSIGILYFKEKTRPRSSSWSTKIFAGAVYG